MVLDISQLKKIRKNLDLTQHQFAQEIGISQSMVAKIESGKLDPTYSYVKKIESSLSAMMHKEEKTAQEIMTPIIVSAGLNTKVQEIIKQMKSRDISQVPVLKGKNIVGLVTESSILAKNPQDLQNATAQDVLVDSPPIISPETKLEVIKHLLNYYPCVLVKKSQDLIGIITKADLLKNLF